MADGRVRVDAFITRTGVFEYRLPDGKMRREYRPPHEVFKADSLETFSMVPVTNDHPPTMLNAGNAKQYAVGTTGEQAVREDSFVRLPLMVFDAATISDMNKGKIQVSAGYNCDTDETPGVSPEGEPYDAIQTNIVANHVAIVARGRAGAGASVRMDAAGYQVDMQDPTPDGPDAGTRSDEKESLMTPEEIKKLLAESAAATARADAADAALVQTKARFDALQGERDALAAKAEAEAKARTDAAAAFLPMVNARVALVTKVAGVLKDVDLAAMSDREIKVAAIKRLDNVDIAADKSDDYVNGRFDVSIERTDAADAALAATRGAMETSRKDAATDPETAARNKMIEENANAWKTVPGKAGN